MNNMTTVISFLAFTGFVAAYAWYKLRKEKLDSQDDKRADRDQGGHELHGCGDLQALVHHVLAAMKGRSFAHVIPHVPNRVVSISAD